MLLAICWLTECLLQVQTQQHSFNMPFQLAVPGPEQYTDTCESAVVYELELEAGDVVVLATDGVLDNLWDQQIADLVYKDLKVGSMCHACLPLPCFCHNLTTKPPCADAMSF